MLDITARKDAESKAEAAEDRFRTLAERGPAVVYSFELAYDTEDSSPRLSVQYVSPQAAELVRYPIDRWLGKAEVWFEMVHPDDRERLARATEHNWRTGRPWSIRYRMIRSDGSVIWLMDAGRMLERDSLGRPCDLPGDPARRDRGRGGEDAPRFVRTRAAARARGCAGDPVVRDDPS